MKVRYTGGIDAVAVPLPDGTWITAQRNRQIEVPDEVGRSLCEQSTWQPVGTKAKTEKAGAAAPEPADEKEAS
ncbi:MAG TPA: hypothetical protein VKU87_08980 [Thermomicrobiaceae bacterium]|nr:hypothetical protein [Thermomicrobiaceae bacterium]